MVIDIGIKHKNNSYEKVNFSNRYSFKFEPLGWR